MNKIVPFKKDIIFKTNIDEITSISLEHSLHPVDDHLISGSFLVSGEYKITDTSTNTEVFHYELPFDINMDDHYVLTDVMVDIDDFYYEIVNENILSVNIEVMVDHLKEKELIVPEPVIEEERTIEPVIDEVVINKIIEEAEADMEVEEEEKEEEREEESMNEKKQEIVDTVEVPVRETISETVKVIDGSSIFDTFSEKETYMTYKVYIIREGDSLESVMQKYTITREELECYNDLREIKLGDKLIIPSFYHEQS